MRDFFVKLVCSFFYAGYLPFIPGTFGSAAGVVVYLAVKGSVVLQAAAAATLALAGFALAGRAEKAFGTKDPKQVVIDEVCGMLIAYLFIPFDAKLLIIGFVLFRLFDTVKPYPIAKLERLPGAAGIMSDDIVAGLYTNIVLQIAVRLLALSGT